jgi:vitellogenic carboxypeptidase-like protein
VAHIRRGEYYEAFTVWDELINGDVYPYPNYFRNVTGLKDYDNFLNTDAPSAFTYYAQFLALPAVRAKVGRPYWPSTRQA